jgi:hypothetical protein
MTSYGSFSLSKSFTCSGLTDCLINTNIVPGILKDFIYDENNPGRLTYTGIPKTFNCSFRIKVTNNSNDNMKPSRIILYINSIYKAYVLYNNHMIDSNVLKISNSFILYTGDYIELYYCLFDDTYTLDISNLSICFTDS